MLHGVLHIRIQWADALLQARPPPGPPPGGPAWHAPAPQGFPPHLGGWSQQTWGVDQGIDAGVISLLSHGNPASRAIDQALLQSYFSEGLQEELQVLKHLE